MMSFTLIVTHEAPQRIRGLLASCMLEVVSCVYVAPHLSVAVRDRLWSVIEEWAFELASEAGVAMLYPEAKAPSGVALRIIGFPPREVIDHEGCWLARRDLSDSERRDPELPNDWDAPF